jgi:hypothetical protein
MSAGSGASNLGYSKFPLNNNVNGAYVNVTNSNNPANFSSNEIPPRGLFGAACNMDAAAGIVPGICMGGGKKYNKSSSKYKLLKKKIKNISNIYKMKYTKKQRKQIKNKISRKYRLTKYAKMRKHSGGKSKKNLSSKKRRMMHKMRRMSKMRKSQRGGLLTPLEYGNYPASDNNNTQLSYKDTVSSGYGFAPNVVNSSSSALANPMPHKAFSNMN